MITTALIQRFLDLPVWLQVFFEFSIGAVTGSFLTVVVHRVPIMLERIWDESEGRMLGTGKYNLFTPESACGACNHPLKFTQNIPIFSYLALRGRCGWCGVRYSARYFLLEVATACLAVACCALFGLSERAVATFVFSLFAFTLAFIDAETGLLPNVIVIPLGLIGIAANSHGLFVPLQASANGAVVGALMVWAIGTITKKMSGRSAIGRGDVTYLAALGAWVGFTGVAQVLVLAFTLAALYRAVESTRAEKIVAFQAFGPFLSVSAVATIVLSGV